MNPLVFCLKCGACLGEERPYCTIEHELEYPSHDEYLVKYIHDPLIKDDAFTSKSEFSFFELTFVKTVLEITKALKHFRRTIPHQPKVNTNNTTDKETEPNSE